MATGTMLNVISVSTDYSRIEDYLNMSLGNQSYLQSNGTNANGTAEMDGEELFHNPLTLVIFSLLYIATFALGLFGNFLVCFVVFRQRTMQTVTNFFITNLAFADILLCLFCVTLTPPYTFLGKWIFGKFLCHLVAFLQCWCVYLSTLTLTSIAIDRFFVIIFPFRPRMKVCTCLLILLFIWIFAFILTFPYGYYMHIREEDGTIYCEEAWLTEDVRKVFGTVTSMLQFFLPFFIILVCYLCIFCKLQNNKKKLSKSKNSKKKNSCEKVLKKKTSTNQMLVLMVSIFGICWLPLNVINILDDFNMNLHEYRYYNLFFFTSHLFAMSSVIYNPILYGLLNE
jgi:neuropeptide F receptor